MSEWPIYLASVSRQGLFLEVHSCARQVHKAETGVVTKKATAEAALPQWAAGPSLRGSQQCIFLSSMLDCETSAMLMSEQSSPEMESQEADHVSMLEMFGHKEFPVRLSDCNRRNLISYRIFSLRP